ncbi:hypothetical protein J4430_01315 [Candidatus Woesearchaeota archaeon]|nr:hypothetical protein [Candidatus Woesearchaeota archaeon]
MSRVSQSTERKVKEAILYTLYEAGLKPLYTSSIAIELGRDKEFVRRLLSILECQGLVRHVGKRNSRKKCWRLTDTAYQEYGKLVSD